jgi:hypothetical protein
MAYPPDAAFGGIARFAGDIHLEDKLSDARVADIHKLLDALARYHADGHRIPVAPGCLLLRAKMSTYDPRVALLEAYVDHPPEAPPACAITSNARRLRARSWRVISARVACQPPACNVACRPQSGQCRRRRRQGVPVSPVVVYAPEAMHRLRRARRGGVSTARGSSLMACLSSHALPANGCSCSAGCRLLAGSVGLLIYQTLGG